VALPRQTAKYSNILNRVINNKQKKKLLLTRENRFWAPQLGVLFKTNVSCFFLIIQGDIMGNGTQVNSKITTKV